MTLELSSWISFWRTIKLILKAHFYFVFDVIIRNQFAWPNCFSKWILILNWSVNYCLIKDNLSIFDFTYGRKMNKFMCLSVCVCARSAVCVCVLCGYECLCLCILHRFCAFTLACAISIIGTVVWYKYKYNTCNTQCNIYTYYATYEWIYI